MRVVQRKRQIAIGPKPLSLRPGHVVLIALVPASPVRLEELKMEIEFCDDGFKALRALLQNIEVSVSLRRVYWHFPTLRKSSLPPFSGSEWSNISAQALKMEADCSLLASVAVYQYTWRHLTEGSNLKRF